MGAFAVITGTTHGIGRITCRELAKAGYAVVMANRDLDAAADVRRDILEQVPGAAIHLVHCDLASLASVRRCAEGIRGDFGRVALLINNAGIVSTRHRMSEDGFELTFATNHLGPFLLTNLLLDRLASSGRVINVASRIHYRGALDLGDVVNGKARYSSTAAYARSKLANVMFTLSLARRLAGSAVTANCLHPGVVATNLLPRWLRLVKPIISGEMFDVERGAQTTLHLALSKGLAQTSGCYFDECQRQQSPAPNAVDPERQELLWGASEAWTATAGSASSRAYRTVHPRSSL